MLLQVRMAAPCSFPAAFSQLAAGEPALTLLLPQAMPELPPRYAAQWVGAQSEWQRLPDLRLLGRKLYEENSVPGRETIKQPQ